MNKRNIPAAEVAYDDKRHFKGTTEQVENGNGYHEEFS